MSYKDWKEVRLGDAIQFNPREKLRKNELAKKVAMDMLHPFKKIIDTYEVSNYKGGSKFRNGDTLLARITPCLENGKTAKVTFLEKEEVGFGSTEFIVMRNIKGITHHDFVYYLAISPVIREVAIKSMVGTSGRQRVQHGVLADSNVSIPGVEEQKAIAATLSCLDDKIELNNRINKTLEELAQAIFKSWFVDFEPFQDGEFEDSELGPIPKGWRTGVLGDIADITMGQSPKGSSYNEDHEGTIFYQGRTDFGCRYPEIRLFTTEPKRLAYKGDILVSVRAPVGDVNVAGDDCCIGRGLAALRSKCRCGSHLLYLLLALNDQFRIYDGEGTVFGSISKAALHNIQVVIPPEIVVAEFQDAVGKLDEVYEENHNQVKTLTNIRDALLPKFMSGEIRVPIEEVQ